MKIHYLGTFIALLCAPLSIVAQPAPPSCPNTAGAYFLQGNKWVGMDPSHSMGFKTTNVAGAAFSYGMAKARIKAQFRDGESPYQLDGHDLTMCLVDVADSGRDITLAKFQEEKDHRELPMASIRAWTGVNAQLDPKSIIPVSVDKLADKVYLVASKEPIPSGEFMLFTMVPDLSSMVKANTPTSLGGYDFGAHAK